MSDLIVNFVDVLARVLYIAMIARVITSWINVSPSNPLYPITKIVHQITEPIVAPIRRVLPRFGMLDFSPMVALFLITIVQRIIVGAVR